MTSSLMVFHTIISILLIVTVLLQFGKGAEAGLMGGGSDQVFTGAQQGNILSRITVVLSIIFAANSILLARIQGGNVGTSILDGEAPVSRPLNSDAAVEAKKEAAPTTPATETKK
ncbi:MAG: preprotein translocase subunit SecG [Halobacteriovoraceae bacterium]|jgi:preprotein translocase subunit SecG|nr:preprotein translocase subunit SecG [Halobacteriovoraceae bacterium]MBT5093743.1 preprotein translocase subunit SecG [Halobacteriovoraceae bacterium]